MLPSVGETDGMFMPLANLAATARKCSCHFVMTHPTRIQAVTAARRERQGLLPARRTVSTCRIIMRKR